MTTKQISDERVKILNKLPILKDNKLKAVNPQWMKGKTICEIYNTSNRKRFIIRTNVLFANSEFIKDPNDYILNQSWFTNLILNEK